MADQIRFDRRVYIDRLERAGISEDHARAYGDAMAAALREPVATKGDMAMLRADISRFKTDLTLRLGFMSVAVVGALLAAKFW